MSISRAPPVEEEDHLIIEEQQGDEMAQANLQEGREASQPNSSKYIQSLRAKHKGLCRKLANMNTEQNDDSISQVQRGMLEELKAVQSHVMDLILEELPDDVDEDLAKDEAFHSLYASKAAKLVVIDKKPSSATTPPEVASSSVSIQHHLTIPMPAFDGLYEHWPTFKAMFLDIMKRTNDSDAVKLHHLNKALQGKAAGILNTSILNGNNFQAAWDVLERRFENPRLIVDKHIAGLLQLKHAPRESAKDLRKLAETCKSHVDGLVFMKQTIDSTSNLIITHLLSSCMDADTRKAWESSLEHGEFPDLFKTLDFINRQCEVLESCTPETSRKSTSTKAFTSTTAANPSCVLCQQHHTLHNCPTFIAMSVVQRKNKVQSLKRCFNCLSAGHPVSQCRSKWTCRICKKRHHHLLHGEQLPAAPSLQPPDAAATSHQLPVDAAQPTFIGASMTSLTTAVPSTVLLSTVVLNITDRAGVSHPARALLDSGAQSNFITGRMAQFLELPRKLINLPLSGIGGSTRSNVRHSIKTTIHSRCSSYTASLELLVLPKLSADIPTQRIDISHWKLPETCILADPSFNRPGTIDIILGATHFYEILRTGRLSLGNSMPTLQETEFGWVVSGSATITEPMSPVMCAVATHTNELDNLMKQFFAIEDLSNTPSWSIEERACEDHYTATTTREEDGRYMVQLPRKPEMIGKLGDSRTIALRRFLALERRLQREPDTQRAYVDFMDEYLRLGHMSKVAASSTNDESFYLPHHPVFKNDSTTTKCRVVFDASSKSSTGVSLNDTLMVGPTIQQDATSILLRFRTQPIALTADVTKMYRQVWIHPKDRSLQRIIWRSSPNDPIQEYELNTVTYGTASAPFLAVRSLQQIVADHGGEFPAAAERSCDFYVDDFVSGGQSSEAAQMLQLQTEQLYASAGFELRKWASSDPSVLQNVNQEKLASSPYATSGSKGLLATLGLIWDPTSDTLQFKINTPYVIGAITKRKVLSCIARIYDPLGIVDPVKAMAKQFLQRIWTLQTEQQQPWGWDDELPHHLQGEWINFHNQLIHLQNLHIPRVAIRPDSTSSQFHFFCDASEKGYGACCYIRSRDDNGNITMQLYSSKTKVTPINSKHSIARLELCAAQLASLLYDRVRLAVKLSSPATFWTDSMTVVHWLRASPNCWKPFVANRVSQVQHLTQGSVWRHIPGVDNPADLASRGCLSKDLLDNPLWWQGPSWIYLPEDQWPESPVSSSCEAAVAEQRVTTVACPATEKPPHRIFTLYSSFSKLRRIVAYWVQYFNRRFKRRQYAGIGLTTQDLREAEEVLCRLAQQDQFEHEIKALQHNKPIPSSSKLKWLHPQLGANGIIRVGGRLSNAPLLEDTKHPILVPNNHPLAELLMDHFHKTRLHAGPQLMLSNSRQRYWIIGGRNIARRVYHHCITCFRAKPSSSETLMADLPSSRVTPRRPFSITGIDYCGPVFVKGPHRRAAATKAYIAIFVCFITRAIHIELVSDLTTEAFLSALRRFVARRGLPEELHSDNATNFKGANNQLNELYRLLRTPEHQQGMQSWTLERQIIWKFIPPRAPHFGGIWEAAVRSMKHHLVRVLGNTTLSFEDMTTLLAEIECCLNSRPLTQMTEDPSDATALTPGHFLVGSHLQQVPDAETTTVPENRLTHWRLIQQLKRHFWTRWSREYLQQLQPRSKWISEGQEIKPGHTDSTVAVIIVYCVLFVIAAGGNLSVVITLFRSRRHRRSRVSLMICHLAVADLMVAFIMIPLEVGWRITVQWHAGNVACKVFLFMRAFCLYLSSNVLVCVSLDRCFAVIYPLRVSAARKRGKIMLGGAWFIAFVNAMPQSIIFRVQQHPQVPGFTQCVTFGFFATPGLETAYNLFCVIAMYFLPLMIISGAYTVILCEISNRSREKETSDSNSTGTMRLRCNDLTHIERARQRTLRLTITIVVVFVWCWTPYVVMTLWYMFDRESAAKVDVAVQDGLFLMAVSNSCMNPLVYGSYAMKCRLPCRRRNTLGGAQTPNAAQRRSTDAVSGIIGPHSDRLTGRDNKDELLVADHRSITMNHLNQNGTIALLQPTASLLRSTGGGTGAGAGAAGPGPSGVIAGGSGLATTATTRFYNRLSSGNNNTANNTANNNGNYHNNTAKHTSATGSKTGPSVSGLLGIHRKGGGKEHNARPGGYWAGGSGKGCQPSYSEFAMLADEHSLMLSRPSFYSDPTPHELDSSVECGLTRSLDTGGWR